jgi:hypothetical protein
MALVRAESPELAAKAKKRRALATSLLFDRMCPGGGWNAGNPVVYGAAGEPAVVPTALSLLALRNAQARSEITLSLDWVQRTAANIQSPGSLALTQICLRTHGRLQPGMAALGAVLKRSDFLDNTLVAAWSVLACGSDFWLGKPDARTVAA